MAAETLSASYVKPRGASAGAQLVLPAVTIGLLFGVVLVAPQPLWSGQPVAAPAPDAPPVPQLGWPAVLLAAIFVVGTCLPFRFYSRAREVADSPEASTKLVIALTAGLATVALLIYPRFGSDIFDYLGFERMWVVYGDNPLLAVPAAHPSDWSTPLVWYPTQPPAYGPLWALISWPLVRFLGSSPAEAVLSYKVLALGGYVACCVLVWRIAAPTHRGRALVQFAWSPLVLFEVLGKVHNDVLIGVGALSAVWLVGRSHLGARLGAGLGAGLVAVVAAALVKLTALALAPPLAVRQWRAAGWRALLASTLVCVVLAAAVYAPFWAGAATFEPLLHQTSRVVWSPGALLIGLIGPDVATLVRAVLVVAGVLLYVALLRRGRPNTTAELASTSGLLLIVSLLCFTSAVFAHYLVPVVALAAVSSDRRLERMAFWLSIGGLAAYGVEILGSAFGSDWLGSRAYQVLGSLVLLGPLALVSLLRLPTSRLRRPRT